MFSAALYEDGPAKGTRSSRRRQRPASTDSLVLQPKAKRQRVPLGETTSVNPDAAPETFEVKSDKIDVLGIKRDGIENVSTAVATTPTTPANTITPRKEVGVRSKKPKAGERVSKGDGSVVLTTNNAYTVSRLPALPDRIRADSQNRQHGAVYSSSGYALTLTHTHALVWPYTATTPSPETFVFTLSYPSKHASDPLPLGSLVVPSTSSEEPGLVVVMPLSGKVSFWESISSAATFEFMHQQRSGVEDSIHGMFSGEHVVQLVNAESAGFILVLSSGRLAHMSVRDGHGRPAISIQFLRTGASTGVGGFFGTIRQALSTTALRGDVTAVKTGYGTAIGERVVVAATSRGRLHGWKVMRGGHHEALGDVDVREAVLTTIRQTDPEAFDFSDFPDESFELVDFSFVPPGVERKYADSSRLTHAAPEQQNGAIQHLVALVSMGGKRKLRYSLVEIALSAGRANVGMVRPLTSYTSPIRSLAPERPRIYLPKPALVAFVIFDRAVVIASLAAPPESPDSQLREDSHTLPSTFEDVIDFRDEESLQIIGSGMEEPLGNGSGQDEPRGHRYKTKNPTAVLLVQGVGTIRIAMSDIDRFASEKPPEVTAKSKLEQAVFFGIKDSNPLVFQGRRSLPFTNQEIAEAAMELSQEIVSSKTPFIANVPASLEQNMKTRSNFLERLVNHLNALKINLDERTRWTLLYDAEKMAVATWIWQRNEEFLAERPKAEKKNLIGETVEFINEQQKTEPRPAIGEVDSVRHWFINDVWRLDIFIAWGYQIIKYAWTERMTDEAGINRFVWEAVCINHGSLEMAHAYRRDHSALYGVRPESIPGADKMAVPWTANHFINNNLKRLIEFCYEWLNLYYPPDGTSVDARLVGLIRKTLPSLSDQYFNALHEYIAWSKKSEEPSVRKLHKAYDDQVDVEILDKILKLKDYDLWDEAIELARNQRAFKALSHVTILQIKALRQRASSSRSISTSEAAELEILATEKEQQIGEFINEYQTAFAFHAFDYMLAASGIQVVLDFPFGKKQFKTAYLRGNSDLAKISWINDIERENDIEKAAETLVDLGTTRELQIWNKKVELSLGKLALLAQETEQAEENSDVFSTGQSEKEARNGMNLEKIDVELDLIKIQDDLYGQVLLSIKAAVDEAAELELAMKEHAVLIPKRHKALYQVFEEDMARLLKHEALDAPTLIDLLTLSYLDPKHFEIIGDQFYLALRVAGLALKGEARVNAERLIWRRCLIRDDWKRVNETNEKNDIDQLEAIGGTAMYRTLFSIFNERHYNESFWPVIKPSAALGAFTERLDPRHDIREENFRAKLLEAMKWEDNRLRGFVEKNQLDAWHITIIAEADRTVAEEFSKQRAEAEMDRKRNSRSGNGSAVRGRSG